MACVPVEVGLAARGLALLGVCSEMTFLRKPYIVISANDLGLEY